MLFFLFFVELCLSSEYKIGHRLNASLGILIVYPDFLFFDITNPFFTKLQELLEENITIDSISYSNYSLSNKELLSTSSSNVVFTRNGKFLELYLGNMTVTSIANELNQAFYSFVDIINETNYETFKNETKSVFLLQGTSVTDEFEDIAFYYRNQTVSFAFQYNPKYENTPMIQFTDIKHNTTRFYDDSIPLIRFARSCKVQKTQKKQAQISKNIINRSHLYQITAITDNLTKEAQSAFEYINKTDIASILDFDIVSWDNSTDLLQMCEIEPSELIFVIYSKQNVRKYSECHVFQDMDLFSNELLYFFAKKATSLKITDSTSIKTFFYSHYLSNNILPLTRNPCETSTNQISFIYIEPSNSYSLYDARTIYNTLAYEFYNAYRAEQKELQNKYQSENESNDSIQVQKKPTPPVEFYTVYYNFDNFKLPNADGFPAFVIYKPRNKQGFIYNDIISIEKVRAWVKKFQQEEYEDERNETIDVEPKSTETKTNDLLNLILESLKTSFSKNDRRQIETKIITDSDSNIADDENKSADITIEVENEHQETDELSNDKENVDQKVTLQTTILDSNKPENIQFDRIETYTIRPKAKDKHIIKDITSRRSKMEERSEKHQTEISEMENDNSQEQIEEDLENPIDNIEKDVQKEQSEDDLDIQNEKVEKDLETKNEQSEDDLDIQNRQSEAIPEENNNKGRRNKKSRHSSFKSALAKLKVLKNRKKIKETENKKDDYDESDIIVQDRESNMNVKVEENDFINQPKTIDMKIKIINSLDDLNDIVDMFKSNKEDKLLDKLLGDDIQIDLTDALSNLNPNIQTVSIDLSKSTKTDLSNMIKEVASKVIKTKFDVKVKDAEIDPIIEEVLSATINKAAKKKDEQKQQDNQILTPDDNNKETKEVEIEL